MQYSSCLIYFLTGTGNSYRAATWMAATHTNKGINSKLYQITKPHEDADYEENGKDIVGFVYPTHGFTAPWPVIRHTLHLPRGRGKHAFVVATRAGTKIAALPFPGFEGTAGYLVALLLILKGYTIRGVMGLDMPSNWMSLHWGLNPANSRFIIGRAKIKADSFAERILEGKRVFRGILSLFLGLLLSPISLAYLVIGRFFFAKLFFASESCTGCGLCAKSCPFEAIRMIGSRKPRPYWTFSCESCMRCMGYCPNKAVETSHSLAVLLYFLTTLPVSYYVLNGLSKFLPVGQDHFLLKTLIDYSYIILIIFAANLMLFWLIKIPLLNKLCTYTTLTHLYRRYHEPDTSLMDIRPESKK
ncbi:EFR1 family ferrodoxin [Desulfosporosinus sp. OT]|uniref:EFR1 family ferrodoxin n=1 Tax=Desulfosporosinus sp. OT TaxID=913865 RepID=UPI000223A754|nr:EFR1 family ferrodoxin [Desulfosporosinus sp. OT]EGW39132.1 4Fe-4S binding domain protein [Desulfosporosinus sp. OT]